MRLDSGSPFANRPHTQLVVAVPQFPSAQDQIHCHMKFTKVSNFTLTFM